MRLFDPNLYEKVHLLIILALSFYSFVILDRSKANVLLNRSRSINIVYVYAVLFILIVGLRPLSPVFGDTVNYARTYDRFSQIVDRFSSSKDLLFYSLMWLCSRHMGAQGFFLIVEILYVVPIVIGCCRLLKNNADMGLLFCFAAFSFFTYGVNGLRNGVALSLVFLALTFLQGVWWEKIICFFLSLLGIAFHASAALPVICMIIALYVKKPGFFFVFWLGSIIVSLLFGSSVEHFFASLGFDNRLSDYLHPDIEEDIYTVTGFRWDFILYSAMPIILGWYVIFKKRVLNSTYLLLLGTYILANAFWIMVIRAEFSNRFAYLSWFLYPIVLAYPLLKLKIWPKTQGRKTAVIMAAHYAFTFIMVFLLK